MYFVLLSLLVSTVFSYTGDYDSEDDYLDLIGANMTNTTAPTPSPTRFPTKAPTRSPVGPPCPGFIITPTKIHEEGSKYYIIWGDEISVELTRTEYENTNLTLMFKYHGTPGVNVTWPVIYKGPWNGLQYFWPPKTWTGNLFEFGLPPPGHEKINYYYTFELMATGKPTCESERQFEIHQPFTITNDAGLAFINMKPNTTDREITWAADTHFESASPAIGMVQVCLNPMGNMDITKCKKVGDTVSAKDLKTTIMLNSLDFGTDTGKYYVTNYGVDGNTTQNYFDISQYGFWVIDMSKKKIEGLTGKTTINPGDTITINTGDDKTSDAEIQLSAKALSVNNGKLTADANSIRLGCSNTQVTNGAATVKPDWRLDASYGKHKSLLDYIPEGQTSKMFNMELSLYTGKADTKVTDETSVSLFTGQFNVTRDPKYQETDGWKWIKITQHDNEFQTGDGLAFTVETWFRGTINADLTTLDQNTGKYNQISGSKKTFPIDQEQVGLTFPTEGLEDLKDGMEVYIRVWIEPCDYNDNIPSLENTSWLTYESSPSKVEVTSSSSGGSKLSTGAIVGIICAAVFVCGLGTWYCCMRKSEEDNYTKIPE